MDTALSQLLLIGLIILGVLIFTLFITVFGYLVYRIRNSDYSDQSGWNNFARPFLGFALFVLFLQIVIAAVVYFVSK